MDNSTKAQSEDPDRSTAEIYFERFLAVWQNPKPLPPARLLIVFFAGLALICVATAVIGAVPTRRYGHDIFFFLGNGWRVINGQRPHLDFTSPWGPVSFLVSALGLTISRSVIESLDGRITLAERAEPGALFEVELPLMLPESAACPT